MEKDRKQLFIELVAQGKPAYRAALEAGYSPNYAKAQSDKLLERCRKEVEELKPIAQEAIKEAFKYTAIESFKKFVEIQNLAMKPDKKGNYCNLPSATKCEELKGRLFGAYEEDNSQKTPESLFINVIKKDEE